MPVTVSHSCTYTAAPVGSKLERLHTVIYSGNDQLPPRTGDNLGIVISRGGGPALPNRSTSCTTPSVDTPQSSTTCIFRASQLDDFIAGVK